jgi:hypothetical protein
MHSALNTVGRFPDQGTKEEIKHAVLDNLHLDRCLACLTVFMMLRPRDGSRARCPYCEGIVAEFWRGITEAVDREAPHYHLNILDSPDSMFKSS